MWVGLTNQTKKQELKLDSHKTPQIITLLAAH
jgi:hypothetical protein